MSVARVSAATWGGLRSARSLIAKAAGDPRTHRLPDATGAFNTAQTIRCRA